MIVLVCGGREFADADLVNRYMNLLHDAMPIHKLIHGGSKGADALAGAWARAKGIKVEVFFAEWEKFGKRAGHIRNVQMADQSPDQVVAFPGGRGTADMIREARRRNIAVALVEPRKKK